MPTLRRQHSQPDAAPESGGLNEPMFDQPVNIAEHVSDPHGTIAMLLMLLLMLLLAFLVIAIAQSV